MVDVAEKEFLFFVAFLKQNSGYNLVPDKKYLLESRLTDVLRKHKIATIKALIEKLERKEGQDLFVDVIESMTVNETYFFRDKTPFDILETHILPEILKSKAHIRIWSAACSTGQEPYSIAMTLENHKEKNRHFTYEIIASDINKNVIEKAKQAFYSDMEVSRGLPEIYRDRYFTKENTKWQIAPALRSKVQFKQINLKETFPLTGNFDVIFLRNVLIYFEGPLKADILKRVGSLIRKDAYLFLGASESVYGAEDLFQRCDIMKYVYKKS